MPEPRSLADLSLCLEVRIPPAQPPSRGISRSLQALSKQPQRSAESVANSWRLFCLESAERREFGRTVGTVCRFFSTGRFLGSHLRMTRWSLDPPCNMMCIEVRIRCTQPPSRRVSGSLPTVAKQPRRSAEVCHQLAAVLRRVTRETLV